MVLLNEWMVLPPSNFGSYSGAWMTKFAIKVVKVDSGTMRVND